MPQGVRAGTNIVSIIYTSPLGDIVKRYNTGFHFCADNNLDGDDQVSSVAQIEYCVRDIERWMARKILKLNRDETELLDHDISSKLRPCPLLDGILVSDCPVCPSKTARNM